jgi:hypothetical protein
VLQSGMVDQKGYLNPRAKRNGATGTTLNWKTCPRRGSDYMVARAPSMAGPSV